jgi:hypothetical protein
MTDLRWQRIEASTGVGFVILVVVGTIVGGQPGNGDVVPFFVENRARVLNQSLLFGLASVLFLWFLGTLRQHLASAGGSAVRFSSVAFAGGIVTLGMLLRSGTVVTALADGVARHAPEDVTRALYSLTVQASDLTSFGVATLAGASALASLRSNAFPTWVGWLGVLLAAALADPRGGRPDRYRSVLERRSLRGGDDRPVPPVGAHRQHRPRSAREPERLKRRVLNAARFRPVTVASCEEMGEVLGRKLGPSSERGPSEPSATS